MTSTSIQQAAGIRCDHAAANQQLPLMCLAFVTHLLPDGQGLDAGRVLDIAFLELVLPFGLRLLRL